MNSKSIKELIVVGGGLSGCEAAWQAAESGINVTLYEMRPKNKTNAHISDCLAELVCSNSFGSKLPDRASGLIKIELNMLGSLLLSCAYSTAIPAGSALAVDRKAFSELITKKITSHPLITIVREEMKVLPEQPAIIATGPLTSDCLTKSLTNLTGQNGLYFFDAISPILYFDTIDMDIAFRASRFQRDSDDDGDYINCPMSNEDYSLFVSNLIEAQRIELRDFESDLDHGVTAGTYIYFESCLPIEIMAKRGENTLAFGPLRPIGLINPKTGNRPYAVVQLRQDDLAGKLYNMVGFQTNLTYQEQKRVFRMIPGLKNAEFIRYGQMHRNTYIASPLLLKSTLQLTIREDLFITGQLTGVEGYMGNIATGLIAGLNAARYLRGEPLLELPEHTMIGALINYITHANPKYFQPMKANFGILPNIPKFERSKRGRSKAKSVRAINDLTEFMVKNSMNIKNNIATGVNHLSA